MRILHCCLSCSYNDGYAYQENILPRINAEDGHEVLILASTEVYVDGKIGYVEPRAYQTEYGVPIIRLPYAKYLPGLLGKKLRVYPQFARYLRDFAPDVILFHGVSAQAITVVAKYRRSHPEVKLYVDSHTAFYNSARNLAAKLLLYIPFYRSWLQAALPYIDKVLYIGLAEKDFLTDFMHTSEERLEFYPLGGNIVPEAAKAEVRSRIRSALAIGEHTRLYVHSGRMDAAKLTVPLMRAFSENPDLNAVMLIIGVVLPDVREEIERLLKADERIRFLGWRSSDELRDYICAADMYLQPGAPSVTMQMALCCGTPVMIQDSDFYRVYVDSGGTYPVRTEEDLREFFGVRAETCPYDDLSQKAYEFAKTQLDYKVLAQRLYR